MIHNQAVDDWSVCIPCIVENVGSNALLPLGVFTYHQVAYDYPYAVLSTCYKEKLSKWMKNELSEAAWAEEYGTTKHLPTPCRA